MSHLVLIILDLYLPWNPYLPWMYQMGLKWRKHLPSVAVWCQNPFSVLHVELPLISKGSSVFSAGHSLSSTTDRAASNIWILQTSVFLFFFFLNSIWKLLMYYLNFTEVLICRSEAFYWNFNSSYYIRSVFLVWFSFLSERNWKK